MRRTLKCEMACTLHCKYTYFVVTITYRDWRDLYGDIARTHACTCGEKEKEEKKEEEEENQTMKRMYWKAFRRFSAEIMKNRQWTTTKVAIMVVVRSGELPTGSFEYSTVVYAPSGRGSGRGDGGGATSVDGATVYIIVYSYKTRVLYCVCGCVSVLVFV